MAPATDLTLNPTVRAMSWMSFSHRLLCDVTPRNSVLEVGSRWARSITREMGFRRAVFMEMRIDRDFFVPLAEDGPFPPSHEPIDISFQLADLLIFHPHGFCNDPGQSEAILSPVVRMERFHWFVANAAETQYLFAAGYDAASAAQQPPLTAEDHRLFQMAGQQAEALLRNSFLVTEMLKTARLMIT